MSSDEAEQPRKVVLHFERDSANIVFALLPAKVGALQAKCAVLASPGLGFTSYLPSFSFGVGWNARRNRLRKVVVSNNFFSQSILLHVAMLARWLCFSQQDGIVSPTLQVHTVGTHLHLLHIPSHPTRAPSSIYYTVDHLMLNPISQPDLG